MSKIISLIILLAALAGCNSQPYVTPERLDRGLVIVLPGIEGRGPLNEAICRGLDAGGVDCAIELCDWTSALLSVYNLRAESRNRRKAAKIARRIAVYQWDYPGRPVVLVGQSGGGAIAVWIAESLPAGHDLDGIIMIAPALSPKYMLDFPLERAKRGIINFYSGRDWVFLGMGTLIYGTMDGYHTASAGMMGFDVPEAGGRPKVYDKLFQIGWQEKMARTGHTGGHLSSGTGRFVSNYVAPFVRMKQWNTELIAKVLNRELEPAPETQPASSPVRWKPTPSSQATTKPSDDE